MVAKRYYLSLYFLFLILSVYAGNPIDGLLERIDKGASKKFKIEKVNSDIDFFELDQKGKRVVVRGNSHVNIASGINWYLKYYAGVHLSWNNMQAKLPEVLPSVDKKERRETSLELRYNFNYCTFSYSMPFWDWNRWEQEIDWMALHGVNMPLAAVGQECVWNNMLKKLGYSKSEINEFIAGPAFLAWWEMNNLEGWGGPNPDSWYVQQEELQKKILKRMGEFSIEPVFPGYSGMLPHNAGEKLNLDIAPSGLWNGFQRPAFIQPTDNKFAEIADLYYQELESLYGKAKYYSMDPFHESRIEEGFDFDAAGKAVLNAMKKVNNDAVWVIQGWDVNPREAMTDGLAQGDILILDLFGECRPMWGIESLKQRDNGYKHHNWIFCLLQNFGANVGLHGRMDQLIDNYYQTKGNPLAANLKGIGFAMEGIENNPVMYELMSELPWRDQRFTKEQWIVGYAKARYGTQDSQLTEVWNILIQGIYNCPKGNNQQGAHESIFCGRPSLSNFQVSSWSKMANYYDPASTEKAARVMIGLADKYKGNDNFEYDLVDILRQAISDRGRIVYNDAISSYRSFDRNTFEKRTEEFMSLILLQDRLLSTRPEFCVGRWLEQAKARGNNDDEKRLYEWNARVQITTWGNRYCADTGKLRDYAHKEWNGLLKDFYYPRWDLFWNSLKNEFDGAAPTQIDFYAIEEPWTLKQDSYCSQTTGNCVETAKDIFNKVFGQ